MTDRRKRRRSKDADARDGDRYDRDGLAMKRLIPAERRSPRSIARERSKHRHYAKSENR